MTGPVPRGRPPWPPAVVDAVTGPSYGVAMTDLVDMAVESIGPGDVICLGGAAIEVTAVERGRRTVDLHTCYGPALRLLPGDTLAVVVAAADAA